MTDSAETRAREFRRLHEAGRPLLLPNAWDPGSARLIESCGADAIATTSAGLAWSRGYPDGDVLPSRVLAAAVADIARVLSVPLTVDIEGGYSSDPSAVGEIVSAVVGAGAVGINLEDGAAPPDLLCAKIAAVRVAADRARVPLFVNARADVYLRGLVPPEQAAAETIERARRYREAGCDGLFVPGLREPAAIRAVVAAVTVPLNVMVMPGLPPVTELEALGVRRISAGAAIAQAAYGIAQHAARQFLADGRYDAMFETTVGYADMNRLFVTGRTS
jgi:2-methylisocitrate lyase-like PEP mutase family enzyme